MSRRKKADPTAAPSEPRKRRRRSKADQPAPQAEPAPVQEAGPESQAPELPPTEPPAQDPVLAQAEQELTAKYAHVQVIPGTLRPGGPEGWGTKRILDLACVDCGATRTIATSDAFHSDGRCAPCSKAAKKARKKKEQ
jgi:hypothetical protein